MGQQLGCPFLIQANGNRGIDVDPMPNKNHKKVNLTSSNLSEEKLAELRRILPEAFSEEKIDWDKLRTVLGDDVDAGIEKFGFTWAGKSNAIKNVLMPSKATLTPATGESVKFDESENLFIEGDNLEVLKLLQKAYFEQVKMIYIDPPYNTGGDFVYRDNFTAPLKSYLQQTGQVDAEGNKLQTNRETNGRYHSDWLSMMYPRLKLAWNLLRDDGVIFISIDDNEVSHLRMMMDEIFGEENFIESFIWVKKTAPNNVTIGSVHEYILVYGKNQVLTKLFLLSRSSERDKVYSNPDNDPRGPWKPDNITSPAKGGRMTKSLYYEITSPYTGEKHLPPKGRMWSVPEIVMLKKIKEGSVHWGKDNKGRPMNKRFLSETRDGIVASTLLDDVGSNSSASKDLQKIFNGEVLFETPKPVELVVRLLNLSTQDDDLILDFFAGAGATAHAVMAQNSKDGGDRKWICIQLPEVTDTSSEAYRAGYKTVADISKERIRRAAKIIEDEAAEKRGTYNGLRDVYGYKEREIKEVQSGESGSRYNFDDGFKVFKLVESNYPENTFEFNPEQSEIESQKAFEEYLDKAKQSKASS